MKNHNMLTICIKNHYTNNSYQKPLYKYYEEKFFIVINQINKHKAKIYNQCIYT